MSKNRKTNSEDNSEINIKGLEPEQAYLLLLANEQLIAQQVVKTKKPLTANQLKILREIASKKFHNEAPEGYELRVSPLCKKVGIHRTTFYKHYAEKEFPKRIPALGWNVAEVKKYFIEKNVISPLSLEKQGEKSDLTLDAYQRKIIAEAKKEEARAKLLEIRALKDAQKVIEIDQLTGILTQLLNDIREKIINICIIVARNSQEKTPDENEKMIRELVNSYLNLYVDDFLKKKYLNELALEKIHELLRICLVPHEKILIHKWVSENIIFDISSPRPGYFNFDSNPCAYLVLKEFSENKYNKLVMMASAQSGKTTTIFSLICWAVFNDPGTGMWVMADYQSANEIIKNRFIPFFENNCIEKNKIIQYDKLKAIINLGTMSLYLRGSQSKAKLQSTPVKWLILDEVRNYRQGALDLVTKRVKSVYNSKIIFISTPDVPNGSVYSNYLEGNQFLVYFDCPYCGYSQPFSFGKTETIIKPKDVKLGRFFWDENEITRPGGIWNWSELEKTIYYECGNCKGKIFEEDRKKIANTFHLVAQNKMSNPKVMSVHFWSAYIPWIKWRDIVVDYLLAEMEYKSGNIEAMKSFFTEVLGEPFMLYGQHFDLKELKSKIGNYYKGERWNRTDTIRFLTCDIQKDISIIKFVYRQWTKDGQSRLIDYGSFSSFDDVRKYQLENQIKDKCVWIDSGYRATEVYKNCLKYGWIPTKGDRQEGYQVVDETTKRFITVPYRIREVEPFFGTALQGKMKINLVRFSNNMYKDKLYLYVLKSKDLIWELPQDIGEDYYKELSNDELVYVEGRRRWIEKGTNDFGDCEILQLVAVDVTGIKFIF